MFKRNKKLKAPKKNDTADLIALQQTYLKQINDQFSEIGHMEDPAEKITRLKELGQSINKARKDIAAKRNELASSRTNKTFLKASGVTTTITVAACVVPAIVFTPVILVFLPAAALLGVFAPIDAMGSVEKNQLEKLNADFADFWKTTNSQASRASTMLDEMVRTCDLKAVARSPLGVKVTESHELLRDRFAAAAISAAAKPARKPPTVKKPGIHL